MFEFIKKALLQNDESKINFDSNQLKLYASICILLVDIANIDGNFSCIEKEKISSIMKKYSGHDEYDFNGMIEKAEQVLKKDDSIYDYTQIINKNLNNDEKYELLKNLWRLVYADMDMDKYEEHSVKKIGGLLDLDNRDIIAAKLRVKEELKI